MAVLMGNFLDKILCMLGMHAFGLVDSTCSWYDRYRCERCGERETRDNATARKCDHDYEAQVMNGAQVEEKCTKCGKWRAYMVDIN